MNKRIYFCAVFYIQNMVKETKINYSKLGKMVQEYPKGLVLLSSWLVSEGYSYELQQQYRKSGWLRSIGKGAMLKSGDPLLLSGALLALQFQAKINIHYGGRSALELQGSSHYLQLTSQEVTLFALGRTKLPPWFTDNKWDEEYNVFKLSLFKNDAIGLVDYQSAELGMKISSPARAMIECLSLCPNEFSLTEAYELMEGLSTLRPKSVQEILEECKSIKAKRLFLYFAERAGHSWFKYIDQTTIDIGSGNRSLVDNGVLVAKYKLVLPEELA
ncbi:type IV toxin-antitoxin system AbiEi family antitoxin domain-containing protein [Limibacterium fermenti]|uniref:type IV toxin-antitoxin system AbiEi family antitoxin domain-containing protein n=1 Tax=Limibacterium fermenti TaxID=3229863 RepID=UPI0026D58003